MKIIQKTLFQNTVKSGVADFANIIKTTVRLTIITVKNSMNIKRITNYALKCNLCLYLPT